MIVRMRDFIKDDVLAGASNGAVASAKLISACTAADASSTVIVDFRNVRVATGSFLRECILGLRDHCRRRQPPAAVVVANANSLILEELRILVESSGDALVVCAMDAARRAKNARVLGALEEKQRATLAAVLRDGVADARSLHERFGRTEKISVTGWNNRLAALAQKGILIEEREGRTKRYRPVVEELRYGS